MKYKTEEPRGEMHLSVQHTIQSQSGCGKDPPSSQELPCSSTAFVHRRIKLPWETALAGRAKLLPKLQLMPCGAGDAGTGLCIQREIQH